MKILISAAEASSDAHAARLLGALQVLLSESGESLDAFGVGGPKLQAAGLRVVVDARTLLSMGFVEILGRLPRILRSLKLIAETAERENPQVAVVVDYPDFHFRLARRLKRSGIPVVYLIPPKVWVWRQGRVAKMRELFRQVLCIFPFEEAIFTRLGMPVTFVGNPLVEELPMHLSKAEARLRLGIDSASRRSVVLVMPGSRPSELKEHLDLMLEACEAAARAIGKEFLVLCPFALTADLGELEAKLAPWRAKRPGSMIEVRFSQGDAHEAMAAADAGLVKSGTSTLEAGLMSLPHAVVYRPSRTTEFIFKRFIRYAGPVGLVNLVAHPDGPAGRAPYLCRELLMDQATVENLSSELQTLLVDESTLARMREGFQALRARLRVGPGAPAPSRRAAEQVLNIARAARGRT